VIGLHAPSETLTTFPRKRFVQNFTSHLRGSQIGRFSHGDERNLSLAAACRIHHVKKRVAVSVTERPPAERRTRDAKEPGGIAHVKQSRAEPRIVI
jgi:hypothetical protein